MTVDDILTRLDGVRRAGDGHTARCPAHQDNNASLSIGTGTKGIVLKCHAGCSVDDVTRALGISVADLFTDARNGHVPPEIVATYDYTDEQGKLLFQVCRFAPKDFRQRRPDPSALGGWNWSTKGVRRVLYNLPKVLDAAKRGIPVLVVEGEKDVAALARNHFTATCNPGGAGKWLDDYSESLRGADVVIVPDNDEPGRKHAELVASKLRGSAKRVRIVTLPVGKDAHDFFAAGKTAADLVALIDAAPDGQTPPNDWLKLVEDAAAIMTEQLPPVVEIVNGLIAEQCKVVIGSGSKSYKTWLTIDVAMSIAHGTEFLGRSTLRRKVLYVNLELKPSTFKRRIQTIAKRKGIEVQPTWFRHLPLRGKLAGLLPGQIVSRIIDLAKQFGAEVVILDPVYKLNTVGDENSSRDQTILFNELDRLTTEANCTLILNDHFGKGNQSEKDPLDAIRGSSAKGGDVDAAIILRRHEVEECFRVDVIHRELPPVSPFCIGWEFPLMALRPDLDPEQMKKPKGGRPKAHAPVELLSVIAENDVENPISVSAWAFGAKINRTTLIDYLPSLRAKGYIQTVGEGKKARQCITKKGVELLETEAE